MGLLILDAVNAAKTLGIGLSNTQTILESIKKVQEQKPENLDKKLVFTNLPPNLTIQELVECINGVLRKTDVKNAWIAAEATHAFVEF